MINFFIYFINFSNKKFIFHNTFYMTFLADDLEACNELTMDKGQENITKKLANIEAIKCIVCQKLFTSNKRMQIHLVKKHYVRNDQNVTKEYKCDKCEKFYTTRANLLIHDRLHTGLIAVR